MIGPAVLQLYASTTDDEVLWFVSLREIDPAAANGSSPAAGCAARTAPWMPSAPPPGSRTTPTTRGAA